MYSRPGNDEHLQSIRDGKFDVELRAFRDDVVLPSVWADVILPDAVVGVVLWSDSSRVQPLRHVTRSRTGGVEFADTEFEPKDEWRAPISRRTTFEERRPAALGRVATADEWYPTERRETGSDDGRPPPPRRRSTSPGNLSDGIHQDDSDGSTSEEETDEESTSEDAGEETESVPRLEQVRVAVEPLDVDGNELAFTVDTKWVRIHSTAGVDPARDNDATKGPGNGGEVDMDRLKILKSFVTTSEGRTTVQLCTLPGPESPLYAPSIGIRWYHIHAEQLDWTRFKACLRSLLQIRSLTIDSPYASTYRVCLIAFKKSSPKPC